MFVWPVLTFCSFSSCYGESSTQQEIFDRDVEPLIQLAFSGVVRDYTAIYQLRSHTPLQTVTVFADGVTSSGKTHTMQGNPSQPGIIPRAVEVSEIISKAKGAIADLSLGHLSEEGRRRP